MILIVYAVGGLIDSVESAESLTSAVKKAEQFWSEANPETDDVKIFADDGTLQWEPKRSATATEKRS